MKTLTNFEKRDLAQDEAFKAKRASEAAYEKGDFELALKFDEIYTSRVNNSIQWQNVINENARAKRPA